MRILLVCLMLAVAFPAFGAEYATFAPVPLCSPGYETFAPTPIVPSAPVQRNSYPVRSSNWTYPGEITDHLMREHGITAAQLQGMSRREKESYHSDLHEGRVRARYTREVRYSAPRSYRSPGLIGGFFQGLFGSSNCPNGNCPR